MQYSGRWTGVHSHAPGSPFFATRMLWKYLPVKSSARDGQQTGVWMNQFLAVAPCSESACVAFAIGVHPPRSKSMSSVRNRTMLGEPALARGAGGAVLHA